MTLVKKLGKQFSSIFIRFYGDKSEVIAIEQLMVQCHHAKRQKYYETMIFYEAEQFINKQMAINCITNYIANLGL